MAYRLRGKEKLELIAKLNSSYLDSFKDGFISNIKEEWARTVMLEFAQEMEDGAMKEMSGNLDQEITLLSRHCGWKDSRKCKGVLSTKFGDVDKESFVELDKLIDSLIDKVNTAANNALQPTSG